MSQPGMHHSPSSAGDGTRSRLRRMAKLAVALVATTMSAGVVHSLADLASPRPAAAAAPPLTGAQPAGVQQAGNVVDSLNPQVYIQPGHDVSCSISSSAQHGATEACVAAGPCEASSSASNACAAVHCLLSGSSSDVDSGPASQPASGPGSGSSSGTSSGAGSGTSSGAGSGSSSGVGGVVDGVLDGLLGDPAPKHDCVTGN